MFIKDLNAIATTLSNIWKNITILQMVVVVVVVILLVALVLLSMVLAMVNGIVNGVGVISKCGCVVGVLVVICVGDVGTGIVIGGLDSALSLMMGTETAHAHPS